MSKGGGITQIRGPRNARFKHGLQSALKRMGVEAGKELRPALRDLAGRVPVDNPGHPDARLRS